MRKPYEIATDREKIVAHVRAHRAQVWIQVETWMRPVDIAALVRDGRLLREVRKEWDSQGGHAVNLFGGAGVMQRHRAYIATPENVAELKAHMEQRRAEIAAQRAAQAQEGAL